VEAWQGAAHVAGGSMLVAARMFDEAPSAGIVRQPRERGRRMYISIGALILIIILLIIFVF
jgi:hypothetical protein